MPKLNSEEKERERYSSLSFPLRCSRFLSQCTRHNSPPAPAPIPHVPVVLNRSLIPRTHTFHDSSREPMVRTKIPLRFMGNKLIVNFCVLVCDRVRCYILLLPSPTERKRKQLRLEDYFFFPSLLSCLKNFREREMTNGGCFESCESREGLIQENFSHMFSNCEISE